MSEPHTHILVVEEGEQTHVISAGTQLSAAKLSNLLIQHPKVQTVTTHRVTESRRQQKPALPKPADVTPGLPAE